MTEQVEGDQIESPNEAVVSEDTASEATETTEGQEESQPAKDDDKSSEDKTESQKRRERRKAHEQKLMSEAAEAKREAEETRKRLDRIKAAYQGEAAPKESDFPDPLEYAAASAVFRQRQADVAREQRAIEEQANEHDQRASALEQERRTQRIEALEDQKADARSRYADFDAVFDRAFIPQHVAELVLESEQAADVAYHLGQKPALAREIAQMHPLAAARELGRIEAMISLPKPNIATQAPEPITPVRGQASAQRDPAKMSFEEYRKWRAGQK